MKTANKTIEYQTKKVYDFIDVTEKVINFVKESNIKDGLVNVQITHTSAAVLVNENEPLLIDDFKDNLEKIAGRDLKYKHDNMEERTINVCENECINGHAHCKAIYLPVNVCLNLVSGKLQLGTWQRIFLVELDRSRPRKIQIQIIGE